MKRVLALSIILAAVAVACNKNNFETIPTVEIKSLSPDVAIKGNIVTLKARITDKEGDLQDSVLVPKKFFLMDGTLVSSDTLRYSLETLGFPDTRDIEFQLQFIYADLIPPYEYIDLVQEDQNFAAGIVVIDKGGHRSEYVESGKILLKKL